MPSNMAKGKMKQNDLDFEEKSQKMVIKIIYYLISYEFCRGHILILKWKK